MLDEFNKYIRSEDLFDEEDRLLLAVSGGIDSMVMLNLFSDTSYKIAAAHCNFGLRAAESDDDQVFVEQQCKRINIPLYTRRFDTVARASERGTSLQMAARDLRYEWFEKLCIEYGYSRVAIAHNKNDLVETFLLNLSRGTGIRGLSGIKPRNDKIVRPLLFAGRDQITMYAGNLNIQFREDSSNLEIKYKRNRIRHRIIPEFEALSASFTESVVHTANRLKEAEIIIFRDIETHFNSICVKKDREYYLGIDALLKLNPLNTYLFEFLRRWKFPKELVPDIITSLSSPPGKQFYSPTHRLVKDRDYLIITPRISESVSRYYIDEDDTEIHEPVLMKIRRIKNNPPFRIPASSKVACLDLHLLHFPLIIRKWEKGDYFRPLGMSGLKKVSDYFIDKKLSLVDKENTWIVASGNKVVWIAGHRLDDRFKITGRTKDILIIELPT